MKRVVVLGSTGSIGRSTLAVIRSLPGRFQVAGLTANESIDLLEQQARAFRPRAVAMLNPVKAEALNRRLARTGICVYGGAEGLLRVARTRADMAVSAMVGAAGLMPTLEAIRSGKDIALANKEPLVMAGQIFMREAGRAGVRILPVDSEHSAIFQCLQGSAPGKLRRILLTASGGPFLRLSMARLRKVTARQALDHPTWKMGPKVTLDSATLMNKGLEVIEAHHLFGVPAGRIEVVIQPQSIIHSMVEFADGSILGQMSRPDMKLPIQYALTYPERLAGPLPPMDFFGLKRLDFIRPDRKRFPCLGLAYRAVEKGRTFPAVLNAANEVAVAAFLAGRVAFTDIPRVIGRLLDAHRPSGPFDLKAVQTADRWARREAAHII